MAPAIATERMDMNEICDAWIARARSEATKNNYMSSLRRWHQAFFESPDGNRVSEAELIRFGDSMSAMAKSSREQHLRNIKALFRWGHEFGHWQVSPAVLRFRLSAPPPAAATRYLSPAHVEAIINAAHCDRDRLMMLMLWRLGIRSGELRGLTWDSLHYDRLTVTGKGDKTRSLKVPSDLLEQLKLWQMATSGAGLMFRSHRSGSKLSAQAVNEAIARAATVARKNDATIPSGVTAHWFRHSLATAALNNGAPVHQVQTYLGHANPATTLGVYAHADRDVAIADFV
ncbi:MAG: tyrosine-type recombinase/integrase [Cyanophyceae cyanobacterium]